ncbi:MAG: glycosyltransferase family A protein [Candidatus Sulfotelmatobacter sp.]
METAKSNQSPQVSIIIPAYNTADLIAGCLDSVFSQTYQDFEVIVVNDGAPDTVELERVLQPYQDRIVYIVQQNKRAAGARNTAIGMARGEFLAFLDSDDRWLPEHLASQMKLFAEDPTLGMVYCNGLRIGDQRNFMDACPSHGPATFAALITEQCQICVSTVVARKSELVNAGLFDESLLRCDDYEMWVRAAFHGAKIGYSRKVQALLNGGRPGSLSQSSSKMAEGYWTILDKISRTFPLKDSDRTVVEKRKREIRSRYLVEEGKFQLHQRRFDRARELFSEANQHSRRLKLNLVLLGLRIAPRTTNRFFSLLTRMRSGTPA